MRVPQRAISLTESDLSFKERSQRESSIFFTEDDLCHRERSISLTERDLCLTDREIVLSQRERSFVTESEISLFHRKRFFFNRKRSLAWQAKGRNAPCRGVNPCTDPGANT